MFDNFPDVHKKMVDGAEYAEELEKLKYCLRIGDVSFQQEKEREKAIDQRAENIMKYSTLLVAVVNVIMSLINNQMLEVRLTSGSVTLYVVIMIVMICCLILSAVSQRPRRFSEFPDGVGMFEEIQSDAQKYANEHDRLYELLLRYTLCTEELEEKNDQSACVMRVVYALYVVAIVLMTILLVMNLRV